MSNALRFMLSAAVVSLVALGVAQAQKHGKTRPMTTHDFMEGLVGPQNKALKAALDAAPASDEDWKKIAVAAALLNESSYTLMEDGRCPDGTWSDAATKMLRPGTADLLKAAAAKDLAAAKAALAVAGKSCKGCHEVHKPKKK
jgi:hypothetical protein